MNVDERNLPVRLREGRARMAERCMAAAAKYLPARTVVEYRKALTGRAWPRDGQGVARLQAPRPVTRKSLYIFLHEVAHLRLHDRAALKARGKSAMPSWLKEYEAEMQAHAWMRAEGIAVPRSQTQRARRYVARKIRQACRRGARRIAPEVLRFAEVSEEQLAEWQRPCAEKRGQREAR